jgi:hypothetical protein
MKTAEEVVSELLVKYDTAEVDRLVAYYRKDALEGAYRKACREEEAAEQRTMQVIEELKLLGAQEMVRERTEYSVPTRYRYRFTGVK